MRRIFLISFFATLTTHVFADDTDRSAEYILNRVFDGTNSLNTSGGGFSAILTGDSTVINNVTDGGVLYSNNGVLSTDTAFVWDDTIRRIQFGGSTGTSISGDAGIAVISSIGNTNNENLTIDLEAAANEIRINSQTGATTIYNFLGFRQADDQNLQFGNSADALVQFDTAETNDSLKITSSVGSATQSGNIIFAEAADINTNFAVPIAQDVTTVWQGSDATQVTERGKIWYNSTLNQFFVSSDTGALVLGSTSGIVSIDAGAAGEAQLNLFGSSGGCLMFRDRDNAGYTEVSFLDGTIQATVDADGACDGS